VVQVTSALRQMLGERGVAVQELPLLQRATVAAARCTADVDLLLGGWRPGALLAAGNCWAWGWPWGCCGWALACPGWGLWTALA
jgi:hypothetical protein